MFYQSFTPVLAAGALILAAPLAAQEATPAEVAPVAEAAPPTPEAAAMPEAAPSPLNAACCMIPARTLVEIEIVEPVGSRISRTRQEFAIRLAEPLVVDGRMVAPAGTPGMGEVVHAARARAAGKAGELILAARYLDVGGTRIPLRTFRYGRSQGTDNSGAVAVGGVVAAAVLPVASLIGFLIPGGEVNVPAGTRANAQTAVVMMLPPVE